MSDIDFTYAARVHKINADGTIQVQSDSDLQAERNAIHNANALESKICDLLDTLRGSASRSERAALLDDLAEHAIHAAAAHRAVKTFQ